MSVDFANLALQYQTHRDLCTEDDFVFRQGKNARNEEVYAYK